MKNFEGTVPINSAGRFRFSFLLLISFLCLLISGCASLHVKDWEGVTVTGRVTGPAGQPVEGAYVYAYLEGTSNTMGPAEAMSESTTGHGIYILVLPRGNYVLVARKRLSGSISGPMRSGDLSGQLARPLDAAGDRENIDVAVKAFRQGTEGVPNRILATDTRIIGKVVTADGAVLPGMNVFAYIGSFHHNPPDYMALATDTGGRFEISLPGGGSYTIGARKGLGGKPGTGELMGFWGENDQPRSVEEGMVVEGVVIVVRPYKEIEN